MKKTLLAALAAGLSMVAGTAAFADGMQRGSIKDAPVAERCNRGHRLAGFYIGGNLGYAEQTSDTVDRIIGGISLLNEKNEGFTAGLAVGHNWVCGNALFGIEADLNWAGLDNSRTYTVGGLANLVQDDRKLDWYGTLRTKSGIVLDNVAVYLTGGLAYADIKHAVSIPVAGLTLFDNSDVRWGWTVGAGVEIAQWSNVSLRTEALYMSFENKDRGLNTPLPVSLGVQDRDSMFVSRIGLNIKLGN